MRLSKSILTTAVIGLAISFSAQADDTQVIAKIKDSKISLLSGIQQAEKSSGPVISAKFEMDDNNNLSLSIYTAPQGLSTPAESNDLTELSGDPTVTPFAPAAEIFKDKEHIARASVHLTVMQMSKFTLTKIILQALQIQPGVPYSVVNPMVRSGRPVADVFIADGNGHSIKVTIDVHTGQVIP